MKRRKVNLLIICTCAFIAIGILIFLLLNSYRKDLTNKIVVKADGRVHEIVEVANMTLVPAETKLYEVDLYAKMADNYTITMDFIELEDGGLGKFVDVVIKNDQLLIYEGKLDALFDTELLVFQTHLSDSPQNISITYTMDGSTGNDAKKAFSTFNIDILIEKD